MLWLINFFLIIIIIFLPKETDADNDETSIRFKIQIEQFNGTATLTCDHSNDMILQNKYTVREGELFKIITEYKSFINHFMCNDYYDEYLFFKNTKLRNFTTFKLENNMGTLWKCTILAHKYFNIIKPVVQYKNETYAAAYCFMKIHVRRKELPQTVLVNNMVLPAVRTNLSEKLVDFTTEYQYVDGDIVVVTCANFLKEKPKLTMEYEMAGTMSDKSTMKDLSSSEAIGFVTKMNSAHNNSYMICTYKGPNDYTKVTVKFVMRTKFNIVSIEINGMNLRTNHYTAENHIYRIEYKYQSYQSINVVCEVERRADVLLIVPDDQFKKNKVKNYYRTDLIRNKKTNMSFYLDPNMDKQLACAADYLNNGRSAEISTIHFTDGNFPIELNPLHIEFLSNGTVIKLYSDIIFYEFEDGETLKITCGPLHRKVPGPLLYLELKYSVSEKCNTTGCTVSKTIRLTRNSANTEIICYIKQENDPDDRRIGDRVYREIKVILRDRVLTSPAINTTVAPAPKQDPLHIELLSNGSVMKLCSDNKLKIIYYEFEDGETLKLNCGPLHRKVPPGPLLYLELKYSVSEKCKTNGCTVSKTIRVTRNHTNTEMVCYLKQEDEPLESRIGENVHREIRVILRERVLTTPAINTTAAPAPSETLSDGTDSKSSPLVLGGSIGALLVVLAVTGAACYYRKTRNAKRHIESPYGDLAKQSDISTSPTNRCDNQYDVCYKDSLQNREAYYETPGSENMDPEKHPYTEIDYSRCKPNTGETQTRNNRVYDEPYVHINVRD